MATIEKDCLLVTKAGDNLIINYPYTKAQNVDGAVLSVLGVSPDDSGNVNLTAVTDLQEKTANIIRHNTVTIVSGVTIQNGIVYGDLTGNADTANTATKAIQDDEGNVIKDTYIKSVNNITPDSSGNVTIEVGGNDEEITNLTDRVTTLENKTSIIDNNKRVSTSRITATQGIFGSNNQVTINNAGINVTGDITAKTFNGALNGNAKTATKATQDNKGNVISDTYANKGEIPTKISQLENDSGFMTEFPVMYVNAINKNTSNISNIKGQINNFATKDEVPASLDELDTTGRIAALEQKTAGIKRVDTGGSPNTFFSGTVQGTFIGSLTGTASNADKLNNVSASLYALKSDIPDVSSLLSKISALESKVTALESKLASYEGAQGIMWK